MKSRLLSLFFVVAAPAPLLGVTGCSQSRALDSESVSSVALPVKLSREHHEIIDDQDGLFVTYWERDQDEYPKDDL